MAISFRSIIFIASVVVIGALILSLAIPISENPTFKNTKAVFEILYFISCIILTVTAVIALEQINLAKIDINLTKEETKMRSHREAIALTAKICHQFAIELVPRTNAIANLYKKLRLQDTEGQWIFHFLLTLKLKNG